MFELLSSSCFFFLMIRRPPRSTLFPSRRSSDLPMPAIIVLMPMTSPSRLTSGPPEFPGLIDASVCKKSSYWRSEEHTSELQSQSNLVCRLLLEKKKKKKKTIKIRKTKLHNNMKH